MTDELGDNQFLTLEVTTKDGVILEILQPQRIRLGTRTREELNKHGIFPEEVLHCKPQKHRRALPEETLNILPISFLTRKQRK